MSESRAPGGDLATEPLQAEKSLGQLFGDLTTNLSVLFRDEVELAKIEAKQELKKSTRAGGMFAGAGVGAWLSLLFFSLAVAWLLDQAMNTALAFAIVGAIWGAIAAVLAIRAKHEMSAVKVLPETVDSIKEDLQWAKTQKS